MRKRLLATLLSLALILSTAPTAFAASDEAADAANALYQLGLFNGTGTDAAGSPSFDLDRTPTRYEAVTMLVRLLGKEDEANAKAWDTPFTDTADWAKPYVGYAYENKLTSGTSGTDFGGGRKATVAQYITFVLRALGYESGVDFQWSRAWELSDKIGLTNGQYDADTADFTRGDVVIISKNALSCKLKGKDATLIDDLTARGAVKEHAHSYVTETVLNGGHYEQVQVDTQLVQDYTTATEYECKVCGHKTFSYEEHNKHTSDIRTECYGASCYVTEKKLPSGTHQEPVYETRWMEDPPTTINVCEICGKREIPEHTHSYVTKTISEGGHYEQVQVGTETVTVGTEKYLLMECRSCHGIFVDNGEFSWHTDPSNPSVNSRCINATYNWIQTVRPIVEEKPVYENRWVADSETTIRICEICGQQEP